MNKFDPRIDELFSTITDLSHVQNINRNAFNDISQALLTFHDIDINSTEKANKTVCDASLGHGKTTSIIAYLKWITKQEIKQPILLAVKEKQLAHEIYNSVLQVAPNSIINIDSENRNFYESDLYKYQIVIIQHQRLKNLALGFGELYAYDNFAASKPSTDIKKQKRIKRKLIIDEKPDFVDSVIFDINSINNILDWFEELSEPLKISPIQIQKYKSYIMFLLSEQLADNLTDHTYSLFQKNDDGTIRGKNLLDIIEKMKAHDENKNKFESLNKLKHFERLLTEDDYGRIDDYDYYKTGRKIIVSKLLDYSILNMHLLVFDGTARANGLQYVTLKFKWAKVENRNDYSRLFIQVDNINTTKYSRSKEGNPTQKAIAKRIRELYKIHNDLFVLPMKDEISTYINEYAIKDEDKHYYIDNQAEHIKGVNLLNTTGKNFLHNRTSLYLTSLPKKNADYYKCLAIAFYGNDLSNLMTNKETDNGDWFRDCKLEMIYKHDLYAELLQIIHRSALRKIDEKQPIHIYIAYNEDDKTNTKVETFTIEPISNNLNERYLKGDVNLLPHYTITDMSLYGRDKKIEGFAKQINEKLSIQHNNELSIGKISTSFSKYIRTNWATKSDEINEQLKIFNVEVIEKKDRYSNNSKYVKKI